MVPTIDEVGAADMGVNGRFEDNDDVADKLCDNELLSVRDVRLFIRARSDCLSTSAKGEGGIGPSRNDPCGRTGVSAGEPSREEEA